MKKMRQYTGVILAAVLFLIMSVHANASDTAENIDPPGHSIRKLDLSQDTLLDHKDFSIIVPKGWSYQRMDWDKPHASGKVCKKPKPCSASDWVVIDSTTVDIALSPTKDMDSKGSMDELKLGVEIKDVIPANKKSIQEKYKFYKEVGGTAKVSTETWNGRNWELLESEYPLPMGNTPVLVHSWETKASLKHKDIEINVMAPPADAEKYRGIIMKILSSVKIKE